MLHGSESLTAGNRVHSGRATRFQSLEPDCAYVDGRGPERRQIKPSMVAGSKAGTFDTKPFGAIR